MSEKKLYQWALALLTEPWWRNLILGAQKLGVSIQDKTKKGFYCHACKTYSEDLVMGNDKPTVTIKYERNSKVIKSVMIKRVHYDLCQGESNFPEPKKKKKKK